LIWGTLPILNCAFAEPIARIAATATVITPLQKRRLRKRLNSSELLIVLIGESPLFD
jgi:hypothetical protein